MENKLSRSEERKPTGNVEYHTPELRIYGDLKTLSKGKLAYSNEEAAYQQMNVS